MPSPNPIKKATEQLKRVRRELETTRRLARIEIGRVDAGRDAVERASEVLIASELTYLLRLFAAFEGGLVLISPTLKTPRVFDKNETLGQKLDQLGSDSKLATTFRTTIDDELREFRNELMHGRSYQPRLSFDSTLELMRSFIRGLR